MKFPYFALILLVLGSLACSFGSAPPPNRGEPIAAASAQPTLERTAPPPVVEAATVAITPVETETAAGQCENRYYPVVQGAWWEYQLSGMSSGTFVRSIPAVHETGFDDQDVFSAGVTRQGSWECKEGNLISLTPDSGAAVTAAGVQAAYTIESNSGISFPANPQPAQEWTQNIVYLGHESANGVAIETRNVMDMSCKALGIEKVSVPAGEFEALRIDCSTKIDIFVSGSLAFSFNSSNSTWYAPGIGMVKSSGSTNMGATETVLLSYSIP